MGRDNDHQKSRSWQSVAPLLSIPIKDMCSDSSRHHAMKISKFQKAQEQRRLVNTCTMDGNKVKIVVILSKNSFLVSYIRKIWAGRRQKMGTILHQFREGIFFQPDQGGTEESIKIWWIIMPHTNTSIDIRVAQRFTRIQWQPSQQQCGLFPGSDFPMCSLPQA